MASLLHADDMERDIDAKIWAVLSRSGSADPFTLLLDLLCDVAQLDEGVAFDDSPLWQNLIKYGLEPFAWALLERHFGYRDDAPSLARFIPRLLVTDLGRGLKKPLADRLDQACVAASESRQRGGAVVPMAGFHGAAERLRFTVCPVVQ